MNYMDYIFTYHAKRRLIERSIPEELIKDALRNPTKISYDNKGKIMIKKLYAKDNKHRLLLIVGEVIKNQFKIITIIDTSKVKKYL